MQIFSYGGSLTYLLRYTTPVEVTNPALTVHPDVIIKGKNGVEMTYKNQMMLQPNTVHKILAHFNEVLHAHIIFMAEEKDAPTLRASI